MDTDTHTRTCVQEQTHHYLWWLKEGQSASENPVNRPISSSAAQSWDPSGPSGPESP